MIRFGFIFSKLARLMKVHTQSINRVTRSWWNILRSTPLKTTRENRPLRLELCSLDQLEHHAKDLAERHEVGSGPSTDRLLLRLANNEDVLTQVYGLLNIVVHGKDRISPAGEWLLDNFHLIEEQIRTAKRHFPRAYSHELPYLMTTDSAGYPRVYDIALEVIANVDGRVDKENIFSFVAAYQKVTPLKLGECWAIPIMLRLALIENLRRVAVRVALGMKEREQANYWADRIMWCAENEPRNLILAAADMARSNPSLSNSFVAEFVRRLHGQGPVADIPLTWIEQQLAEKGQSTEQAVQLESQQQAANQVSVAASIGSLRFLAAMDWREFVESMSTVEVQLLSDPAEIYGKMDFRTRDHYRHVVENIAKRSGRGEHEVARKAIELAEAHAEHRDADSASQRRKAHVGYYLIDKGLCQLKQVMGLKSFLPEVLTRVGARMQLLLYLGSIVLLTVAITILVVVYLASLSMSLLSLIFIACLLQLCASQVAVALVNWWVTLLVKPTLLPRLDFSNGIPLQFRTLVAIPSLLLNLKHVEDLLEGLEVRYLANRNSNMHFALLTDFSDATIATIPEDDQVLQLAMKGIEDLNAKYKGASGDIFFLFHRVREWNPREKVWMGYERKRAKLEALNAWLRSDTSSNETSKPFAVIVGDRGTLRDVKYVITLDTDTKLPRDAARELVATMAHPLNQPFYDPKQGRVTEGYGILQPRIAISLPGSQRSLFVRLFGGDPGIDPYTRAVSDVYQDLFLEGSFIGKGIYDVDAFTSALSGKLPENLILSHDLLEGCHARSGLVSDVLLYEDFPYQYGEDIKRRHRWIRGDWQVSFWLASHTPGFGGSRRPNRLSLLSRWKILDNLRRSLVPIGTLCLLAAIWVASEKLAVSWFVTQVVLGMVFLPSVLISFVDVARKPAEVSLKTHLVGVAGSTLHHLTQALFSVAFLPYEAFVSFDAITRSTLRMFITHRKLLEWRPTTNPKHSNHISLGNSYRSMAIAPVLAIAAFAGLAFRGPQLGYSKFWSDFGLAMPFLVLWIFSPAIAFWLSRPLPEAETKLTTSQLDYLHRLARKTWRFFETFVGAEDHWLPPDNFQEYPTPVIAHRTSPTNMGLSLLANLAAYDFGYISAPRLMERTSLALATMEGVERFRGHFYNWYDTISLKPLSPLYVSTVDSGNLAALLITLSHGLRELPDQKLVPTQVLRGLIDTLDVLKERGAGLPGTAATIEAISQELASPLQTLSKVMSLHEWLSQKTAAIPMPTDEEVQAWVQAFERQCRDVLDECLALLTPWMNFPSPPKTLWQNTQSCRPLAELKLLLDSFNIIPTPREVTELGQRCLPLIDQVLKDSQSLMEGEQTWLVNLHKVVMDVSNRATEQILMTEKLAEQCEDLSVLEFDFLYDKSRHLLSIGYNVGEHRCDNGFYDLLASESRLSSFVAIAQGCLPQEHWFALGRLLTTHHHQSTLLSWSGSMFEYLMPLLVMPTFKHTLLDQTYGTVVQRQIEYGREHGAPWGISESGYNMTDVHLNYQYRAFGVPGLGFKRGLADDLVIAPYASVMSLMVTAQEACANLQRMKQEGYEGRYGFYEAIDYTPQRLTADQSSAIVKSFMAHHQGMSFLSLVYCLLDRKMQKRFQSNRLFQATELLLHERVPKEAIYYPHAPDLTRVQGVAGNNVPDLRVIDTPNTFRPEVHLLSNGRYHVMITNAGAGYSRWKDIALTRWREDPICDNWGTFCYLHDVTSGEVWSASHQPSLKNADYYEAIFPLARAEFRRHDHGIEMHTEITVSPEDDIEIRRLSITNLSSYGRIIELTSYAEVVLAPQSVDESHPAFSNLFVQTEIVPAKQAILVTRRPRFDKELTPTLFHLMTAQGTSSGEVSYETDRARFIGRGGSVNEPLAMKSPLSNQCGSVLDPIVAIRCRIIIEPEQTTRVHIVTGIGDTKKDALRLTQKYLDHHQGNRVFELAWTHRQVALRQLDITEINAQLYGALANSILYANPSLRASRSILTKNRRGQSGLWGHGISGDLPIVLLRIGSHKKTDLVRQLVQAHGYWRMMGLSVELVIWNDDSSGYRQVLHEQISQLIAAGAQVNQIDRPGGIFVRRSDQMSEEDRWLLQTVARAIITDGGGTLADHVNRRPQRQTPVAPFVATETPVDEDSGELPPLSPHLLFSNGLGGFSPDGREYVITSSSNHVTPAPWSNVIANPHFGTVVSESGAAYTWCENAHEYRLTPWTNDALTDSSGEAFYLRDEMTGEFWSPMPLPARAPAVYVTRHGFGYSVFEVTNHRINSTLTTFVAMDAPVKMVTISIRNDSPRARRLSVTGYCEWVLGELRSKSLLHIVSESDPTSFALFARNPYHAEFGGRIAFFNVNETMRTVTCDRSDFLGRNGRLCSPEAMHRLHLSGKVGAGLDSCAAIQTAFDLAPKEERELVFVLGVGRDVDDARILIRRFVTPSAARRALETVKQHWERSLGTVQIKTPDPSIDILANGWLLYQVLGCRLWARSGYYQSGGAFGFRDQLQDTMALLHSEPDLLREHILRCASRQYREGDVQHWWHPTSGYGVRTHFSDDFLWLPLATCRYVLGVGDTGVLDKRVHFIDGRQVKLDEEAYGDLPSRSDESATLYEHCVRALNRGMKYGVHGLPLMGSGDWNDGMNLVGQHGRGESVWLAFFMVHVLKQFSQVAKIHRDVSFAETCLNQAMELENNIEKSAWDGQWYRRAYYDSGHPLGSALSGECQIDSIPQSWAVLAGARDHERSRLAMEAVDHRLIDTKNGLIKLFDPPFDKSELNPGYIKGYVPGVRENGGQYTHAAVWVAMAWAALGEGNRAWELLSMINPINRGNTLKKIRNYKVEPYVVAADVYAAPPHTGRGGWTWYTGAAGWMYRLILESLLGLRLDANKLFFAPCIPSDWKQFEIRYRYRETFYDISVRRTDNETSVTQVIVDGVTQPDGALPLVDDRKSHGVQVIPKTAD